MSAKLYRDFTSREQIHEQYDVEATVDDFGVYVSEFVRNSEIARASLPCELDIPYGATLDETFDIFYPEERGPGLKPAVFFVHGGYWQVTTSKEWSYVASGLAKLGIVTVVENYSLCPKVPVSEIVRQHRAAYAYVWRNAEILGIDRNRIVLVGHSVGGHGVAQLLTTPWAKEYGLPDAPYSAAVVVSGLLDVRPIPHTFVAHILKLTSEQAAALSPEPSEQDGRVPLLVTVGEQETDEFIRQSKDFASLCERNKWDVSLKVLPSNHFNILDEFISAKGEMIDYIISKLGV